MIRPACCPRCGSAMYQDYDQDFSCLMCGEMVYQPVAEIATIAPQALYAVEDDRPQEPKRKRGRPARVTVEHQAPPRRPGIGLLRRAGAIA